MSARPHSPYGLENHGLKSPGRIHWTLSTPELIEQAIRRDEGKLSHLGPFVVNTGQHTGRSANDKFTVREPTTEHEIWWGPINKPYDPDTFDRLHQRMCTFLEGRELFVQDCFAGADRDYRIPIRIVNTLAWHNMFARNMFIQGTATEVANHKPEFTVINCPDFQADASLDETHSETFIIVNYARKLVIIGGTSYAGETKKSIFSVMNFLLPFKGVMPMHSSANYGSDDQAALFFGLSGTGKTTLSADSSRTLVGDDEHGWSDNGMFNFEGGCYAKVINLSAEAEPEIYETTRRFGTVLENVTLSEARRVDLDDGTVTENTRASYPISHIPNATRKGLSGHPKHVIFLTCDAFGVLPPVSRLTSAQAMYHFINGYTAKVAGTEKGITEPTPNFSPCYGGPFLPLHPRRYAEMLGQKIEQHQANVWLINTGWTGGGYGVGERISIRHTRAIVNAVLAGELAGVATKRHQIFGLEMPVTCPGVPNEILDPRNTWQDKAAYDHKARHLAGKFANNFEKYAEGVAADICSAGPVAA